MVAPRGVGFLREEPNPGVASQNAHLAILVLGYEFARLTSDYELGPKPGSDRSQGQRALLAVLRL